MRTIKFRGKSLETGDWFYGSYVYLPDSQTHHIIPYGSYKPHLGAFSVDQVEVDPKTVGQHTSLIDSNGNGIYEGDIIKTCYGDTDELIVRFVRGVFAFLWNDDLDNELPTNAPTQEWAIVVGNIHDTPELLKGGGE